jgi:sodium-dependent phosphate transporter
VLSWFVSPIFSGIISILIYTIIKKFIINSKNPLNSGLIALPIIYGLTIFVNVLSVTLDGSKRKFMVALLI